MTRKPLNYRAVARWVSAPMLVVCLLWLSSILWPTGLVHQWPYTPNMQATAFCVAVGAVFAIGLLRSLGRAVAFAVIATLAILIVPRIPAPFVPSATPNSLRVVSLNTYFGRADDQQVVEQILELRPDAVVLIETNAEEVAAVARGTGLQPTSTDIPAPGTANGVVVLVRPSAGFSPQTRDLGLTEFQMPLVHLSRSQTELSLVGVHTVAPVSQVRGQWDTELESIVGWIRGHTSNSGERRGSAGTDANSLIMAGDFNATRAHPRFRQIDLQDCTGHMAHTPTWPSVFPLLRLDHILTSGQCHGAGQFAVSGTDHRGVWADISP